MLRQSGVINDESCTNTSAPSSGLSSFPSLSSACGSPVTLKTGSLYPDSNEAGCYTSGVEGKLVEDKTAGTAIIEER